MSKSVYTAVCHCSLRPSAKSVLKELAWYADDDGGQIWPSVHTLASRTGLTRRGVQKILRELEHQGAIHALGCRLGGRHRTTEYRINLDWVSATSVRPSTTRKPAVDRPIANGGIEKSESSSPENKHGYEYVPGDGGAVRSKPLQAPPYEQQRIVQMAKSVIRDRKFPTSLSKEDAQARKALLKQQLAQMTG